MRNTCVNAILECCINNKNIFVISGDAGLGVFDEFQKLFPYRFLNLGVAEQNMISFSAGLCMAGFKVYVYNIIPFVLYRCYEQVRNDICYQKLPVVLIGIGSGVTYAPQGMTHYSTEDIGLAQTLPNLTVFSPSDPIEAKLAAQYSLTAREPVYIRLAKRGEPKIHENDEFDITKPQVIKKGSNIAIVFHGSASIEAINAYNYLSKKGIFPMLVSVPMVQPLNKKTIIDLFMEMDHVVSVEEHYINCGLGDILSQLHREYNLNWKLTTLGIPFRFIHEIKDTTHMREYFGLSSKDIVKTVQKIVKKVSIESNVKK
jgi:transketolase